MRYTITIPVLLMRKLRHGEIDLYRDTQLVSSKAEFQVQVVCLYRVHVFNHSATLSSGKRVIVIMRKMILVMITFRIHDPIVVIDRSISARLEPKYLIL